MMLSSYDKFRWEEAMAREDHDGNRTVEGLRGRLLAERVASKTAKAEADRTAKRLAELEKQLVEEMDHRERAEKSLKYALKKLEALKVLNFNDQLNLSDSSASSSSPTKCFLINERFQKWKDLGQCKSPARKDLLRDDDGSMSSFSDSAHQLISQDVSWSSVGTANSRNNEASEEDGASNSSAPQDFVYGTERQSSASSDNLGCRDNQTQHNIEESLAIFPVCMTDQEPEACKPEAKNDVYDVLIALRHVREQFQDSIGRTVALYSTNEIYGQRPTSKTSMETGPAI